LQKEGIKIIQFATYNGDRILKSPTRPGAR